MFHRFKNLDKKQKLNIKYSVVLLLRAKNVGVDADLGYMGWICLVIIFVVLEC